MIANKKKILPGKQWLRFMSGGDTLACHDFAKSKLLLRLESCLIACNLGSSTLFFLQVKQFPFASGPLIKMVTGTSL